MREFLYKARQIGYRRKLKRLLTPETVQVEVNRDGVIKNGHLSSEVLKRFYGGRVPGAFIKEVGQDEQGH